MAKNQRMLRTATELIEELEKNANQDYGNRMSGFGINDRTALGVPAASVRRIAGSTQPSRQVALELWNSGIHEAMILSTIIFPSDEITLDIAEKMVRDVSTWDICDHLTGNLLSDTEFIIDLTRRWYMDSGEFVSRAAFSLIAQLDTRIWYTRENVTFFLKMIRDASGDNRNYVRKAVSWALREIGKSSRENLTLALKTAEDIMSTETKSGKRTGREVMKELSSDPVLTRFKKPEKYSEL